MLLQKFPGGFPTGNDDRGGMGVVFESPARDDVINERRTMEIMGLLNLKTTLGVGSRNTNHLHIFSCCALTVATSRAEKENFFDHYHQTKPIRYWEI